MKRMILLVGFIMQVNTWLNAQQLSLVKDINTSGNSYPNNLTVANSKLFFLASDNSGYQKLWVTEGTNGTTVLLLNQIAMQVQKIISYNGKIYFDCYTSGSGQELWESDGTIAGTHIFADIYPGGTGSFPSAFTVANNKLFFMANNAMGERRLYATDGTSAGTVLLKDYILLFNGFSDFAVLNNEVYFTSDGGSSIYNYGLWKSDGTLPGTMMVKPGISSSVGGNAAVLNSKLYFSSSNGVNGSELWVTNGTEFGTYMVKNLAPDGNGIIYSGSPQHITVYNSKLYFFGTDYTLGLELYTSDGTEAGTVLLKDILPGSTGSSCGEMIIYNGLLYFTSYQLQEMWKSDGTTAGTQMVKNNMLDRLYYSPVYNNKMYITGTNDPTVYQSDGTTAGTGNMTATNTINPIQFYSGDQHMTTYNGSLYFAGYCSGISNSYELCRFTASVPVSYSFTGSGNWSNPANWAGGIVPPGTLPPGSTVVINGNCTLDVTQHIAAGASITVAAGKTLVINGSLVVTG